MRMDEGGERPEAEGEQVFQWELPPGPEATELDRMKEELEEAARERGQFRALLQRVQADFANYRRRTEDEQRESQDTASGRVILRLLPVLDDLERALSAGPNSPSGAEARWIEGVQLIARKYRSALEAEGVERIQAYGMAFDPREHEVVSYTETAEHPQGTVLSVVQDGFRFNGKVLRPALVAVAKAPEGPKGR